MGPPLAFPDRLLESLRRHQLLQRDAEDSLNLVGCEDKLRLLGQKSYERPYQKPARRNVHLLHLADDLDCVWPEVYLLFGLPQGRREERAVASLRAATRERHLPGVIFEVPRPERIDDVCPSRLEHDWTSTAALLQSSPGSGTRGRRSPVSRSSGEKLSYTSRHPSSGLATTSLSLAARSPSRPILLTKSILL